MSRAIPTIRVSYKNDDTYKNVLINKCDYDPELHKIERENLVDEDEDKKDPDENDPLELNEKVENSFKVE